MPVLEAGCGCCLDTGEKITQMERIMPVKFLVSDRFQDSRQVTRLVGGVGQ